MQESSLKAMIQSLAPPPSGVIEGAVVSINPLRIQATNDAKLLLPMTALIVPEHLTDHTVNVRYAGSITTTSMTILSGLKVGERVHLLSFNNGKKYFVLGRVS